MFLFKEMWDDENGAIVSIEVITVITLTVLSAIVGLSEVAVAVNAELNDISNAVGALSQSYFVVGFQATSDNGGITFTKSFYASSQFIDPVDDCDTNIVDLVGAFGAPNSMGG